MEQQRRVPLEELMAEVISLGVTERFGSSADAGGGGGGGRDWTC